MGNDRTTPVPTDLQSVGAFWWICNPHYYYILTGLQIPILMIHRITNPMEQGGTEEQGLQIPYHVPTDLQSVGVIWWICNPHYYCILTGLQIPILIIHRITNPMEQGEESGLQIRWNRVERRNKDYNPMERK